MRNCLPLLVCTVIVVISVSADAQQIRGEYLETRSADVYTGQCFANGEVNLVGNEAILAWHVQSGSWDGVSLEGLSIAAAVRANGTLGDPYENPYPADAVLLVDDQASSQQRAALASFAQHMGGELSEERRASDSGADGAGRERRASRRRNVSCGRVCHCSDALHW